MAEEIKKTVKKTVKAEEAPEVPETTEVAPEVTPEVPEAELIPNKVSPVTESIRVGGKDYLMPKFQVVRFKAGVKGYGPEGQHVTDLATTPEEISKVNKFIASSNILHRRKFSHDTTGLTPAGNALLR